MHVRRLTLALFACFALVLGACGSDGDDTADPNTEAGVTTADPDTTGGGSDDGDTDGGDGPCAAGEVLGEAFPGVDFGDPVTSTGQHGIQDVEWTSEGCRWEADSVEVRVNLAGPDDFEGGFTCAAPLELASGDTIVQIADLGDQGWWEFDDFQGGEGHLSICAGERRIDVTISGPRDGDPIEAAAAIESAKTLARVLV